MHATCNATPCFSDRASPVEQADPATPPAPHRTAPSGSASARLRAAPCAFRPCGAARMRVPTHPIARVVLLCLRRTIGCAAYESRDLFAHGTCAARCMRRNISVQDARVACCAHKSRASASYFRYLAGCPFCCVLRVLLRVLLHVACCMLRAAIACCLLRVACCSHSTFLRMVRSAVPNLCAIAADAHALFTHVRCAAYPSLL
jgi:hypothetical protein